MRPHIIMWNIIPDYKITKYGGICGIDGTLTLQLYIDLKRETNHNR